MGTRWLEAPRAGPPSPSNAVQRPWHVLEYGTWTGSPLEEAFISITGDNLEAQVAELSNPGNVVLCPWHVREEVQRGGGREEDHPKSVLK